FRIVENGQMGIEDEGIFLADDPAHLPLHALDFVPGPADPLVQALELARQLRHVDVLLRNVPFPGGKHERLADGNPRRSADPLNRLLSHLPSPPPSGRPTSPPPVP